jgi:hypothetical protein
LLGDIDADTIDGALEIQDEFLERECSAPDQPIRPRAFFDDKLISGSFCYAHAVTPE